MLKVSKALDSVETRGLSALACQFTFETPRLLLLSHYSRPAFSFRTCDRFGIGLKPQASPCGRQPFSCHRGLVPSPRPVICTRVLSPRNLKYPSCARCLPSYELLSMFPTQRTWILCGWKLIGLHVMHKPLGILVTDKRSGSCCYSSSYMWQDFQASSVVANPKQRSSLLPAFETRSVEPQAP